MDFLTADEGTIKILGFDAHQDSTKLKNDIGFLSGEVNLYDNWSGQEHINLVEKIRGVSNLDEDLIEKFAFDPRKKVKKLSTGNKQKLGLILALMHQPKLLILDEPTMGLDPLLQQSIHEILKTEARKGKTIFMSSHNLAEVEKVCDRVCVIKQGKIVAIESVHDLKKKRLYTVYVHFEGEVPKDELTTDGIDIEEEFSDGLVLNVKGDISPLLAKLNEYKLKDLEIIHANLEKVFMEYYR